MHKITRREFIKLCSAAAVAASTSTLFSVSAEALQKSGHPVLWVKGAGCAGCSSSLINTVDPDISEVLKELIPIQNSMFTDFEGFSFLHRQYDVADQNKDNFILVLEGAIPTIAEGKCFVVGDDIQGNPITLMEHIQALGRKAMSVVALGSCASFGGFYGAKPNPLEVVGVDKLLSNNKVINLPGCPPHPDWIVGTLAHLALFGRPDLDDFGRPSVFYGGLIHNNCPRRQYFDNSIFATKFGDEGCLLELGCKGPLTHGDCPTRYWNNGNSWCVQSNVPCIGCTESIFPDMTMPFYRKMPMVDIPAITATADKIGITLGVATGVGLTAHFVGNVLTGRVLSRKSSENGGNQNEV